MKQFALGCIDNRISTQVRKGSEARRLGYETESRLCALIVRELEDLREDLERGMSSARNPNWAMPIDACMHCKQKPCACAVAQTAS